MRTLYTFFILVWASCAFAAHPQLLLDSAQLSFMRQKVANNTTDWQELKAQCDSYSAQGIRYPAAIGGGTTAVWAVGPTTSPYIDTDYFGGGFYEPMRALGACYQALYPTDPTTAATYKTKIHDLIKATANPTLVMTRQSDNAVRYGQAINSSTYAQLQSGDALTVFSLDSKFTAGDVVAVTGAKGCTNANATLTIAAVTGNTYTFNSPPTLNANCTNYSQDPGSNSGYGTRFMIPTLAMAFDWLYDDLSTQEKTDILATINQWMVQIVRNGYGQDASEQNYFSGHFWGAIAAYIATDGDNAGMTSFYTTDISKNLTGANMLRDYHNKWFVGGGYGEGLAAYGYGAINAIAYSQLAMKTFGVDWSQSPYNFAFIEDNLKYFMGFTSPNKLSLDDNEYVYRSSFLEPTYIPLSNALFLTAAGRKTNSASAAKFQDWYNTVYTKQSAVAGTTIPPWSTGPVPSRPGLVDNFMWGDPVATVSDYTANPLLYKGWGGNYAKTKTDYTDTATEVTLLGGPTIGYAGNGKTQFNSGAITVKKGGNPLVVYGLGESARSFDIVDSTQHNALHNERSSYGNKKNSIFWAGRPGDTRNQGLGATLPPPGQDKTVTTGMSSIDRSIDTTTYTYMRAKGLEKNYTTSSVDSQIHNLGWDREVLFLRPKLTLVHDRTAVRNVDDERHMIWTFGRIPASVSAPSGQSRYDITGNGGNSGSAYRGSFTSVLPVTPSVSMVDHNNLHFLYRVEVQPSALDHTSDTWLSMIDTADTPGAVNAATVLTSSNNYDVVQLDDSALTVAGFSKTSTPSLPITYSYIGDATHHITGLAPDTNYKVVAASGSVAISADDGTDRVASNSAGVLTFAAAPTPTGITITTGGSISFGTGGGGALGVAQ